jgi:hypothetical protein
LVRPVLTYGCDAWTLTKTDEGASKGKYAKCMAPLKKEENGI